MNELSLEQTPENLQQLITNLTNQHETVRQNMLAVARERAKELRAAAQVELDTVADAEEPPPDAAKQELRRKQVAEMVKKLRAKPAEGVSSADLQINPPIPSARSTSRAVDGDVEMGGTAPRTPAVIRAEIVLNLERLVDDTIEEIADYEKEANQHISSYQSRLDEERRRSNYPGFGNPTPVSNNTRPTAKRNVSFSDLHSPSVNSPGAGPYGQPSKGILRSTAASPVDEDAIRNMSIDVSEAEADRLGLDGALNGRRLSIDAERRRAEVFRKQNDDRAEVKRREEARQLEDMVRNAQAMRK